MRILNLCLSTTLVCVTASMSTLQIAGPSGAPASQPVNVAALGHEQTTPDAKGWILQSAERVWDDHDVSPADQARLRTTAMLDALRP